MRDLPESRREDFYRTMRQDLDRLNATINNVLNAAMYTDRPVVDPQPLDLARLVRRVDRPDPHAPPAPGRRRSATRGRRRCACAATPTRWRRRC